MLTFLQLIVGYLIRLPAFLFLHLRDRYYYYKFKGWTIFEGWGLHLYVGVFGAGKTCTMVNDAYKLARQFPQLTILSNFKLLNFPPSTRILPLRTAKDILNAPENTLVLIDEIGTIFNSRDFSRDGGVPKILFQHLCQCRKRHLMIYATSQRWNFLDKQLRDIVATVRVTHSHFAHPFTRISSVRTYDAVSYDMAFSNPMLPLQALSARVYLQTDKVRQRYNTDELVENMLAADYVSDEEILANRGEAVPVVGAPLDRKGRKIYRSAASHF